MTLDVAASVPLYARFSRRFRGIVIDWAIAMAVLFGALMLALGIAGGLLIVRTLFIMQQIERRHDFTWQYILSHIILPAAAYLLIVGAGAWIEFTDSISVLYLIAGADGVLLLVGIWRAWDTVTWIARQRRVP